VRFVSHSAELVISVLGLALTILATLIIWRSMREEAPRDAQPWARAAAISLLAAAIVFGLYAISSTIFYASMLVRYGPAQGSSLASAILGTILGVLPAALTAVVLYYAAGIVREQGD
jgi:uncharacterized membrane protein